MNKVMFLSSQNGAWSLASALYVIVLLFSLLLLLLIISLIGPVTVVLHLPGEPESGQSHWEFYCWTRVPPACVPLLVFEALSLLGGWGSALVNTLQPSSLGVWSQLRRWVPLGTLRREHLGQGSRYR